MRSSILFLLQNPYQFIKHISITLNLSSKDFSIQNMWMCNMCRIDEVTLNRIHTCKTLQLRDREPIIIPMISEIYHKVDSPLVMMVTDRPLKWTVDVTTDKTSGEKMWIYNRIPYGIRDILRFLCFSRQIYESHKIVNLVKREVNTAHNE